MSSLFGGGPKAPKAKKVKPITDKDKTRENENLRKAQARRADLEDTNTGASLAVAQTPEQILKKTLGG